MMRNLFTIFILASFLEQHHQSLDIIVARGNRDGVNIALVKGLLKILLSVVPVTSVGGTQLLATGVNILFVTCL